MHVHTLRLRVKRIQAEEVAKTNGEIVVETVTSYEDVCVTMDYFLKVGCV